MMENASTDEEIAASSSELAALSAARPMSAKGTYFC